MSVAEWIGADLALEALENRIDGLARPGHGLGDHRGSGVGWNGLKDRSVAQRREKGRDPVRDLTANSPVLLSAPWKFGVGVAVSGGSHGEGNIGAGPCGGNSSAHPGR
jgi:hypothetical protein